MSMSTSASAGMSTSEAFRKEFDTYNGKHKGLNSRLLQYTNSHKALGDAIAAAHTLPSTEITTAVEKKKALDQLKLKLQELVTEYNTITFKTEENNADLEALKLSITTAIAAKTVAAAAAKKDKDAALAAVQGQIEELKKVIDTRNSDFKKERTSKNEYVVHMVQQVIQNKVVGIKNLLQGEHISQATKDMVDGINKDITVFKRDVKFESITNLFEGRHKEELEAIEKQIVALTQSRSGDIKGMQTALASNPLPLSTTLGDFIREADAFIGTLDTKLDELDAREKEVKAAIATDLKTFQEEEEKISEMKSKINAVVDSKEITAIIKSIDDKITDVESKYGIVKELPANATSLTKQLKITQYATSISGLNAELMTLDNAIHGLLLPFKSFDTIQQQLNDIQSARTSRGIDVPSSLSTQEKIQVFQDKRKEVNDKYKEHEEHHRKISEELIQSRSPLPLVPTPPSSDARSGTSAPRRLIRTAATTGRASPPQGWMVESPHVLKTMPIYNDDNPEEDPESEPVTPPPLLVGSRRNFLYVSHNTEPKTAYLVVVKKQRLDESNGGGGGNKNYHIQKGGAPPERLPEGIEIFPIDVDNPNFLDVMAGLLPPSVLLTVNPDGTGENPIITNIRRGRRPKEGLDALYQQIESELITDENQNPLTIGLRAVYYQNIIKLIRLLDFNLNPGKGTHENMYKKLRKFTDYKDGTFGVLDALFDATFKRNPISPRPNTPQDPPPKIDAVFNKKQIKKIVGWKSNIENTHFRMLFNIFSIKCPNGIKNTFLTDDEPLTQKNLGSKKPSYNQFRLNWIILLAFHTLYIGNTKSETVGELIKALYDAFLGWMATHKDTFDRMFRNTLVRQTPAQEYSEQVAKRINDINGNDPTLQPLVKAIKDELCKLQSNPVNPVNPVNHEDEYDEYENDPEYVPPEWGDSDYDYDSESSDYVAEVAKDLEGLSPAGFSPRPDGARTRGDRRNPKFSGPTTAYSQGTTSVLPPPGNPPSSDGTDNEGNASFRNVSSDVEDNQPPPQPTLRSNFLSRPQSTNTYRDKQPVSKGWIRKSDAAIQRPHKLPTIGLSSDSENESAEPFFDIYNNPASQGDVLRTPLLHPDRSTTPGKRAIPEGLKPPSAPPKPGAFNRQQRPSSTSSLDSTGALQGSANGSFSDRTTMPRRIQVHPEQDTPIMGIVNPEHLKANRDVYSKSGRTPKLVKTNKVAPIPSTLKRGGNGGSHKKRTRKHKKHISRHPTRRRRIAKPTPPEGHKYTRKHPRT